MEKLIHKIGQTLKGKLCLISHSLSFYKHHSQPSCTFKPFEKTTKPGQLSVMKVFFCLFLHLMLLKNA